jgi:hypothetical protein
MNTMQTLTNEITRAHNHFTTTKTPKMTDTQRKISDDIQGKRQSPLNIAPHQVELMVRNAEEMNRMHQQSINQWLPEWTAKKERLDEAQKEFDEINAIKMELESKIADNNKVINLLKGVKDEPAPRLVTYVKEERKETATGFESKKTIRWIDQAVEVLTGQKRFVEPGKVVEMIFEQPEIAEHLRILKAEKRLPGNNRANVIQSLVQHAERYSNNTGAQDGRFVPKLAIYNGKIGLVDWVDLVSKTPKKEFTKPGQHQDMPENELHHA